MKQVVFLCCSFFVFVVAHAQDEKACSKIKTGTFRTILEDGSDDEATMIYRKKDKQIEENTAKGFRMEFDVKWTSACSYELSNPKIIKGEMEGVEADQVVYVNILSVTKEKFTVEVSSNFFPGKPIFEYRIIK